MVSVRRREVVLARISLSIVFVFLVCHSVKLIPNAYEMVQTYKASQEARKEPILNEVRIRRSSTEVFRSTGFTNTVDAA